MIEEEQPHPEPPADGVGVIKYDLDLETGVLVWSNAMFTTMGYDKSEPVHTLEWWAHHIHPEDAMILNETMDMLMYPWVKEWTVEYRFEKADHSYVRVHDKAAVTRDQNGKAVRLTGSIWTS